MDYIWNGDTGAAAEYTISATVEDPETGIPGPANLTGSTSREVIARNRASGVVTTLAITEEVLASGKVTADAAPLDADAYDVVMHVTEADGSVTTYPSAQYAPLRLIVRDDLDPAS